MNIEWINTVKTQKDGYLVNETMSVPNAPGNRHYEQVQTWISEGNSPEPEFTEQEVLETQIKEQEKAYGDALYGYLNSTCRSYNFGDTKTEPFRAVSNYTGYDNEFREISENLGAWIASCMKISEDIKKDVLEGTIEMPSIEDYIDRLPKFTEDNNA